MAPKPNSYFGGTNKIFSDSMITEKRFYNI